MKTRFLLTLCLFSHLSLQAQTLSDLKKGDWFTLEYTQFHPSPEGNQSLRNADIFEYLITVTDRTNQDLQFSIRPVRALSCKTFYEENKDYKATIRSGAYYGRLILSFNENGEIAGISNPDRNFRAGFFTFSDSYINAELHREGDYYWGERDSVTFNLNLKNGSVIDTAYHLEKENWQYPSMIIEEGLRSEYYLRQQTMIRKKAKFMFDEVFLRYFTYCQPGLALPQHLADVMENNDRYSIQITNASFPLAPNVQLSYSTTKRLSSKDLVLEIDNQKYDLQQDDNGMVRIELFLPHPARGKMANTSISITPGDAIHIEKDADGNVFFTGRGAENCHFWQELAKHQAFLEQSSPINNSQNDEMKSEPIKEWESVTANYLSVGDSIFQTLINQYASQMSPFWLESAQLSLKYWYMYQALEFYYFSTIDWKTEPFQSVTPYIDYLYQPQYYTLFLNSYYEYKKKEMMEVYNDVFSWDLKYLNSDMSKYYFVKQFFSGYPKYLMLSETVWEQMYSFNNWSYVETIYGNFIAECKYPDLLQRVTQEYNRILKAQPGANIRNLNLTIERELPLKKTADGYILIVMGSFQNKNNFQSFKEIKDELTVSLNDSLHIIGLNTNIQVVFPERYFYETIVNEDSIRFFWNKSDDLMRDSKILYFMNNLLLIRNDGTIVAKNIAESFTISEEGNVTFQVDPIRTFIKDDIVHLQKAGFDFLIFFILLGTILVSGGVAYISYSFRVKAIRKKEENKRLIAELELKALRSQMNPHFIFNALSSIQHLINQSRNSDANQYLLNFSKLLRMVLVSSEKKLVSLSDEMEQLELYLQLEQLRMPFDYRIGCDDAIQPDNEEIPGMLIQPIVENAVKHGVNSKPGGMITVYFSKEAHTLLAEITDNGAGFPAPSSPVNGFGLKATEERLRLINEDYKTNIGIRMEQNHPSGAKVVISIPV